MLCLLIISDVCLWFQQSFTHQLERCSRKSRILSPLQSQPPSPIYASPPASPPNPCRKCHTFFVIGVLSLCCLKDYWMHFLLMIFSWSNVNLNKFSTGTQTIDWSVDLWSSGVNYVKNYATPPLTDVSASIRHLQGEFTPAQGWLVCFTQSLLTTLNRMSRSFQSFPEYPWLVSRLKCRWTVVFCRVWHGRAGMSQSDEHYA